jgi:hypothetical protein
MYQDLRRVYWWPGMEKDVTNYVSTCLTCQKIKLMHQKTSGLLQPLPIPDWKWKEVTMDFVTGLPPSQSKKDANWVVVDRLTKQTHFIPVNVRHSIGKLTEVYTREIVRLHGVPSSIVSDRDPRFTSWF